jgi:DNA invertase Pin-like site-specific DNA recombinase
MRHTTGIAKLFLQELEESGKLAGKLSRSIERAMKENPDAEFIFNIVWALHRYKARKTKARTSTITAAKLKAAGMRLGRPAITAQDERVKRIKALRKKGESYDTICKILKISKSTAHRLGRIR